MGDVFIDDRALQPARSAADAERGPGRAPEADAKRGDRPDVRIAAHALVDRAADERMRHPYLLVGVMRQVVPVVHEVITTVFLIHSRLVSSPTMKSATSARLTLGNPLSRACSRTRYAPVRGPFVSITGRTMVHSALLPRIISSAFALSA